MLSLTSAHVSLADILADANTLGRGMFPPERAAPRHAPCNRLVTHESNRRQLVPSIKAREIGLWSLQLTSVKYPSARRQKRAAPAEVSFEKVLAVVAERYGVTAAELTRRFGRVHQVFERSVRFCRQINKRLGTSPLDNSPGRKDP